MKQMNKSVSYKIEYKTQHMHTSIKVVNDDNEIMSYQPSVAFICVKQFQNYGNVARFLCNSWTSCHNAVCSATGSPYQQPQQPQPVAQVVLVQDTQLPVRMPPDSFQVTCQSCKALVMTVTEPMNGLLMWLVVGGFCLFGSVPRLRLKAWSGW